MPHKLKQIGNAYDVRTFQLTVYLRVHLFVTEENYEERKKTHIAIAPLMLLQIHSTESRV